MTRADVSQWFGQFSDFVGEKGLALAAIGYVGGQAVAYLRGRLRVLEYSAESFRVAMSTDDAIFGKIEVQWQGGPTTNLFLTTVTLENSTAQDFENLKFRIYSQPETLLLNHRTAIGGTPFVFDLAPEFKQSVAAPQGQQPTPVQFELYRHSREFVIPVFNRGKKATIQFLTHLPAGQQTPNVSLDVLQRGIQVQRRPSLPHVHGIPVRTASLVGISACAVIYALTVLFVPAVWSAALICLVVGLSGQLLGAAVVNYHIAFT
jgi:hypothetical protein